MESAATKAVLASLVCIDDVFFNGTNGTWHTCSRARAMEIAVTWDYLIDERRGAYDAAEIF